MNGFHCGFTEVAMNFCCGFYAGWQIERKRQRHEEGRGKRNEERERK